MSTTLYSYPRTPHLPESPGATSDDKHASKEAIAYLQSGIDLVTTVKMDGGNLTLYSDAFHGRSKDSGTHSWDTYAKQIWSQISFDIPDGWRVSCESMYARRSVAYTDLESPLYIIGIWNERNTLISWSETVEWAAILGLPTVPCIYEGNDFKSATSAWHENFTADNSEGFVVRHAGEIPYELFKKNVAKYVRANHVQTSADWRHRDDFAVNTFKS